MASSHLIDPHVVARMDLTESLWLSTSTPSDADVLRLHRLLARIPPHLADVVRRPHLLGEPQTRIAREIGISQPCVGQRIAVGITRMRLVAEHLPDLLPDEVADILEQAGERRTVVDATVTLWSEHRLGVGTGQSTKWSALFSEPGGFVARRRLEQGPVGDVARGVETIRGWPSPRRMR